MKTMGRIGVGVLTCLLVSAAGEGFLLPGHKKGKAPGTSSPPGRHKAQAVPAPAELLQILRTRCRFDDTDPALKSFQADIRMFNPSGMSFHVRYAFRRPGKYAMRWDFSKPGLPLFLCNQRAGWVCNLLNRSLVRFAISHPPALKLSRKPDGTMQFTTDFGLNFLKAGKPDGPTLRRLFLDVGSIVSDDDHVQAVRQADGTIRVTHTAGKGGWSSAVLDLRKKIPLVALTLEKKGKVLMKASFRVNAPLGNERFALPGAAILAKHLKVTRADTLRACFLVMGQMNVAAALMWPQHRPVVETEVGKKIDWAAIGAFAKKARAAFREAEAAANRRAAPKG